MDARSAWAMANRFNSAVTQSAKRPNSVLLERTNPVCKMKTPSLPETAKCRALSLNRLVEVVGSSTGERDMCALCLCQQSLQLITSFITLKTEPIRTISLKELLLEAHLAQIVGELSSQKLCSPCVNQMRIYCEFKSNCLQASSAFKNFFNFVEVDTVKTSAREIKDTNLVFLHDNKPNSVNIEAIKSERGSCSDCVEVISEKACKTVNPDESHYCNICSCVFGNHTNTINHMGEHSIDVELTATGIRESPKTFECKMCGDSDITWKELMAHMKIHKYEGVMERVVKNKLFCCCCLSGVENLVEVSQKVIVSLGRIPEQTLRLDTVLRAVLNTEDLNRFNPVNICEDCINRAIGAHFFLQTYQQSTETLQYCLDRFDISLNDATQITGSNDATICVTFDSIYRDIIENHPKSKELTEKSGKMSRSVRKQTKLYECTKCDKNFRVKTLCVNHRNSHSRRENHCCRICKQKFRSLVLFKEHKATHENRVRCTVCSQFILKSEISAHMQQMHRDRKLICNECNQCFYRKNALVKHIASEHTQASAAAGSVSCQLCNKQFKTKLRYQMHRCRYMCKECKDHPCVHEAYLMDFRTQEKANPNSTYQCKQCDFMYINMWKLLEHVNKEHLSLFRHKCSYCGENHPSNNALSRHIKCSHPSIKCPYCKRTFQVKHRRDKHMVKCKNLEKLLNCNLCEARFTTNYNLKVHVESHSPRLLQCSECPVKFRSHLKLNSHLFRKHNIEKPKSVVATSKTYTCSMCALQFPSLKDKLEHEMMHPPNSKHICHICREKFTTRLERQEHLRNHKPNLDMRCEICGKMFSKHSLVIHMKLHDEGNTQKKEKSTNEGSKKFVCDVCGALLTRQSYDRHKIIHRNQEKCPHCSKLVSKSTFESHIAWHSSKTFLKQYKVNGKIKTVYKEKLNCDKCDYSTLFDLCYEAHMNKHLNIKPYTCHICNKAFRSKVTRFQHVKTHEGLKPEQCQMCGKRFGSKKSLTSHMRLHTGERPYECDICKLTFVTANRVTEHKARKHFDPQFPCAECSKMFYARRDVRMHMRQSHLGEVRQRAKKKEKASEN